MQVLSYDEAAARLGIVRRTLERLLSLGEGPAVIKISARRRGILDEDLTAWLMGRRRTAPGTADTASTAPTSTEPPPVKRGPGCFRPNPQGRL